MFIRGEWKGDGKCMMGGLIDEEVSRFMYEGGRTRWNKLTVVTLGSVLSATKVMLVHAT